MADELFLIDANALITPHLTYYPFDFAPQFLVTDGSKHKEWFHSDS